MPSAVPFRDVVGNPDQLMGVKVVWGRSRESVMCFGSRGDAALKDRKHFKLARVAAEYAQSQPYLVSIGGGEQITDDLKGQVVELLRITGAYGETTAFVRNEELKARLAQWPVAVRAGSGNLNRCGEWSFCLMRPQMVAEQERR